MYSKPTKELNLNPASSTSKFIHRKMPSLYLRKDYIADIPYRQEQFSRNASVERGVASFSKEPARAMDSGRVSPDRKRLTTQGFNSSIDNKLSQGTYTHRPNIHERGSSGHTSRGITKNSLRTHGLGFSSRETIGSNFFSRMTQPKTDRRKPSENLKSSVDKLKNTFKMAQTKAACQTEVDKKANLNQSSTRYTNDPETTILWRDDIKVDVERELAFTSCLGQGSFAKVYDGYDKKSKQQVAIKVIDKRQITEPKRRALIQTEVSILARMKHNNITEFFRLVEDHKRLFIVMQLCGSLTLNVFCRQFPDKRLNEEQAYALFSQIVKGVKYMHDHNVAHRDLKLTNILVDDEYTVKIIDFGFACEANDKHRMYCGTPSYMAPEIVEKKSYLPKPVDIWSLGVVLYKLLSGEYAFGGKFKSYGS